MNDTKKKLVTIAVATSIGFVFGAVGKDLLTTGNGNAVRANESLDAQLTDTEKVRMAS